MKNIIRLWGVILLLSSSLSLVAQVDTSFNDYGWLKMRQKGADFQTIYDAGQDYYADTANQTKEKKYHHFNRWLNFWKDRAYSTPEEIDNGMYGSFRHAGITKTSQFGVNNCNSDPYSNWVSWAFDGLTPGMHNQKNGVGVMSCVKIDTASGNQIIYAGSPLGGLWKTTDQGLNWYNITDQNHVAGMSIASIDIDPRDNNHLLVGTGHTWSFDPPGLGLMETFDAGQTWQLTGLQNNGTTGTNKNDRVQEVLFHPSDSMVYFAAVKFKLMKSSDQGLTWQAVQTFADTVEIEDVLFHPTHHDTMYLSTSGDGVGKIYRSLNGGNLNSWSDITSNFYNGTNKVHYVFLETVPALPNNLYAGMGISGLTGTRNYKSTNSGNSANYFSTIFPSVGSSDAAPKPRKRAYMISPVNENKWLVGNIRAKYSSNGGASFHDTPGGNYHDDVRGSDYVDGLVALATDGGISLSFNDGVNWVTRYHGLDVQQMYAHDVDKNYNYLITGLQDNGIQRFDIATEQWRYTGFGSEGGEAFISDIDPTKGVVNAFNGVENNFDYTWFDNFGNNKINTDSLSPHQRHSAPNRRFLERPNGQLMTVMSDIFATPAHGTNFTKYTDLLGNDKDNREKDHITAIASSKSAPNMIVIAYNFPTGGKDDNGNTCPTNSTGIHCIKKLLVSMDNGQTWINRTNKDPNASGPNLDLRHLGITDLVISPYDAGKIWLTYSGYYGPRKVFFSADTGKSWQNQSNHLPNTPIRKIVYQEGSEDRLFVTTDEGVYTKQGTSTVWSCYSNNLPAAYGVDLDVNNCGKALTLTTEGRGAWKSPLPPNELVGNVVWDVKTSIGTDLTVSGILTIKDTVEIAAGTKIIVNPGGKLILEGGVLTNMKDCSNNGLWQGIELLGDESQQQFGNFMNPNFPQGFVNIKSGSTIENAEVGIYVGKYGSTGHSGGLIRINGTSGVLTQIKNCRKGIVVTPYAQHNKSKYRHCRFINDGTLLDPLTNQPLITEAHVSIEGTAIVGNEFDYAVFKNANPALTGSDRGIGVKVSGRRIGTTINPLVKRSTFENLDYGLQLGDMTTGVGNDIERNTFTNNQRGVYILSGYSVDIHKNNFTVGEPDENQDTYAVLTAGLSDFDIRENTVEGANLGSQGIYQTHGFIIENSGLAGGIVFDNELGEGSKQLEVGVKAEGDNENLTIRCNEFTSKGNNPHSIAAYDYEYTSNGFVFTTPVELRDQGHPNCQTQGQNIGDHTAAAGNKFLESCSGVNEEVDLEAGLQLKYYWHSLDKDGLPRTEPDCSDPNWNTNLSLYVDCFVDEQATSCAALYTPPTTGGGPGGGLSRKKANNKSGVDSIDLGAYKSWYLRLKSQWENKTATANNQQTAATWSTQIQNGNASSVQSLLIAASPLSDQVLQTAIEKWAGIEDSLLKVLLMHNTPLDKTTWTALNSKGLAAPWGQQLLNTATLHPLRDSLVQLSEESRFAQTELHLAEMSQYRRHMADSNFKAAESLLDSSILSATLRNLVKDHISFERWGAANALLNQLNQYDFDEELQRNQSFVSLYQQLIPVYQNGKSNLANVQVEELNVLWKAEGGTPHSEVEAIHQLISGEFRHHIISRKHSSVYADQPNAANKVLKAFNLFPNPNSGTATVSYQLAGETTALWQVFDVTGKLVHQTQLATGVQQRQLELNQLKNGVYHFVVSLKEERIYNGKLVVTR